MNEEYLQHYGVKGMKWGVRKDRKSLSSRNPNYTDKQRQRDRQFYGKGGERRINRKLNKGQGIQSARNYESDRLQNARNKAQSSGSIGRIVGGVAGGVAGFAAPKLINIGSKHLANVVAKKDLRAAFAIQKANKLVQENKEVVSLGGAAVGAALGRGGGAKLGTSASMRVRGYSPKKARNSTSASGTQMTRAAADELTRVMTRGF